MIYLAGTTMIMKVVLVLMVMHAVIVIEWSDGKGRVCSVSDIDQPKVYFWTFRGCNDARLVLKLPQQLALLSTAATTQLVLLEMQAAARLGSDESHATNSATKGNLLKHRSRPFRRDLNVTMKRIRKQLYSKHGACRQPPMRKLKRLVHEFWKKVEPNLDTRD